jgi:hypothetical protein
MPTCRVGLAMDDGNRIRLGRPRKKTSPLSTRLAAHGYAGVVAVDLLVQVCRVSATVAYDLLAGDRRVPAEVLAQLRLVFGPNELRALTREQGTPGLAELLMQLDAGDDPEGAYYAEDGSFVDLSRLAS